MSGEDSLAKLQEEVAEARTKMARPDTVYLVGGRMLESWAARLAALRERVLQEIDGDMLPPTAEVLRSIAGDEEAKA
jgi:hypothetical protein